MPNEPSEQETPVDPELAALLADAGMWEPPDASVEDAIVAAIAAAAADDGSAHAVVAPISRARRRRGLAVAAAAALVLVVVGVFAISSDDGTPSGFELALAPSELAPGASGTVTIDDTPLGTRLILAVAGLPPAADGEYYEAWLRTGPEAGVSAGTFHLRGGDGEIELWAGVTAAEYPLFTITIQDETDPVSSGRVVLSGRVSE